MNNKPEQFDADFDSQELISASIDGELHGAEVDQLEQLLNNDSSLAKLRDDYSKNRTQLRENAEYLKTKNRLSDGFTHGVMSQIQSIADQSAKDEIAENDVSRNASNSKVALANHSDSSTSKQNTNPVAAKQGNSLRTWIEVVAAVAAIVLIVVGWLPRTHSEPGTGTSVASDHKSDNEGSPGGVKIMSIDGNKSNDNQTNTGTKKTEKKTLASAASREFSVFVNENARAEIDRFWILNDYEIEAPAEEGNQNINVLVVDSKRDDAIEFFGKLKKLDSQFSVFQDSKSSSDASWLAPFDISKIAEAEGDYWTLKIVLIRK